MTPKTIIITGASRGLGFETAQKLVKGGHKVILCSRSLERGEWAATQIQKKFPQSQIVARGLNPSSLSSIRTFAQNTLQEDLAIDVLIHNAGILQPPTTPQITADGLEEMLAVTVLGPFLLTKLLLPALEKSKSARVVNISSRLHIPGARGKPPRFNFDDPMMLNNYDADIAYKNSKLALMWFTYELQHRLLPRNITANAVCPGFVPVTAAADAKGMQRFMLQYILPLMPFADSADKASTGISWVAINPSIEGVGGKFFANCKEIQSSEESYDEEKARKFWQLACVLADTEDWLKKT